MAKTTPPAGAEPIAITGIGCRFPGGARDADSFWQQLRSGTDAIIEITTDRWNLGRYFDEEPGKPGKTYSKWAGLIDGIDLFDPAFFGLTPREAAVIDPQQRLLLEATWAALEDAGQPIDLTNGSNVGVFVGVSTTDYALIQTTGDDIASLDGYSTTGTTMSLAANRISYCFNFLGPSVPVDTACSSSLIAVHLAVSALRNRECEMAVAAGVNVIAGACPFIAFSSMAMLSPDGRCKSFDADANGFVRGEGVGAILLKPLSAALAAGDPIYAVIRATGSNQDGHTPGITVPSQRAQETLVRQACREAGVAPAAVQYVEAHGTGTPVGDPIETNALGSVLREGRDADNPCLIGSVKTNIGHLEAAAGIAGIIKAALVLKHGQVPPNLHFRKANPQIDFDRLKLRVPQELTPLRSGRQRPLACVNSFGWGGANAHVLLEAPPVRAKPPRAEHRKGVQLLPLSARGPESLTALARTYADFLRQPKTPALRDICYSSATRRTHLEHRIAFTGRTKQELASKLDEFARGESRQSAQRPKPGRKIAFVFSGQGPQWWRMGRDLLEREPVFRAKVEECDGMLREIGGWSLLEELTKDESASRLDHTGYAQPAIFALQVALAALWKSWNVTPDAVVGHSVGEVAAAHVAGVLDLREAIRVIYHRGDTMEHVTTEGRMLAAGLTLREAEAAVAKHPGAVFLAAVNSPSSVTLSGEESALTAVFDELTERQVFARFVPVRYAFHSAQMDPVEPELRKALNGLAPQAATIPIASTVTGGIAPGSLFDADYWWRNVRDTVQFADAISALLDAGCDTFLELGPHPVLGISIRECLDQRGERGTVLASLQRGADDQSAMLETLGVFHGMGHSVDWQALFPGGAQYVRLPHHPLQRERYWNEPEASRALRLSAPSHPFLDRRVPCADPCWEVKLDRRSFPYLSDHRIQGRALFPAAGFLEMALASAREMFGPGGYVLENVDLLNALFLPETDHPPTLQLSYHGADSSFVISSSTQPGSRNWTRHVTGRMRPMGAVELPVPCPLADMRERCSTNMPTDAFYKLLYEGGLQYGPTFRGVTHVWRRELEAVAQLALPERLAGQFESYLIHPAYLDACFQPGFLALPSGRFTDEAGVFLPVHVERMQFFSSPDATGWVHGDITRCGSRSCDSDIQLTGPDGQVHVRFTGFRWLLVEGTHREQDDWLFDLQWHAKPLANQSSETFVPSCAPIATDCSLKPCVGWALPTEGSCGELGEGNKIHASPSLLALNPPPAQEAASLGNACGLVGGAHPTIGSGEQSGALGGHRSFPRGDGLTQRPPDVRGATIGNLAELAEFMSREAARLRSSATWPTNRKTMDAQMNELCASYALPALAALGWQPQTGETVKLARLLESLRLPLGAAGRLQTLLMLLQSAGMLERHGNSDAWTVASMSMPRRPKELWQSILPGSPGLAPALILAERVGTGIAGLLHGTADPYAVLFPHGSNAALDQLRSDWPGFRLADRLLAETVAHLAAGLPEGHRLRILEIGSGLGAASARILPVLRPERFDYLYTDVSDRFFADVQKRTQDFPSVSCQTLDLESDPASQDLNPGSFDLILVANGFGTFEWAPESLAKVRGLLAPGGLLLLTEAIRTPPWLTFLMSILRPSGSEALPAIRRRQLEAAGFAEVRALKDAELGAVLALAPHAAAIPNAEPMGAFRRWLLLTDESGCGEALMMQLRRRGHECKAIRKAEWARNPDAVRRAWTEFAAGSGAKGIVHLWSLDIPEAETLDADSLMDAQPSGCLGVLELMQAMTATQVAEMPLLWLVTRGAQPAGDGVQPIAMGQTPLIGLGRVIRTEHPDLPCRSVDLDPAHAICDIDGLLAELFANEQEDEVALRGKARYVQRVGHGALDAAVRGAPHRVDPHEHPCRLEIPKPGLLDRLRLMPIQRRAPEPDEVEIEVAAAGLNFRDVMKTLGIYPTDADDATVLGDECAGRVIAVGERVRDFAVGDEVMAIAPGCFASHVTIHAALVLPRPPRLSPEEAATMLVAYLTAYYALHHLAHLRAGERVLIHSAAGGVGFAAVQLARRAGAEIFATAGSPEKRDFLRACGVEHVMDSRSLAFVDEIMERTGRQGVDVVLNSLAGEFIPQSLSLLGPGGRFLEIGKRDIYQDSKLGLRPFRHNLSFFAVDLSRAMHPDFIREFTTRLRSEFRSGRLSPLPYRCFSIGEAVNAFRYMAQARQIGKIVLTVRGERVSLAPRQDKSRAEFHRDGSYLITGGLSGFGLAVAQWMAVKGARHLVLMSRSGVATDAAREAVALLRDAGVEVVVATGDVSRESDLRDLIGLFGQALPPLRGIVHAAMVIDDGMLAQLNIDRFRKVMAPKVMGAWNLHRLTRDLPLDFFLLFSSAAAVIGNPGQGNYVAANVFLDALAHHRHALGLPALTVNWGFLTEVGYVARTPKLQEHFARLGWGGIAPGKALQMLARLLTSPVPQMTVARIDWSAVSPRIAASPRYSLLVNEAAQGFEQRNDAAWIRDAVMNVAPVEGRQIIETYLREQLAKMLRMPVARVNVDRPLTELGLDSLMAVELVTRIEAQLGTAIPIGKLAGGPTIAKISAVVLEALTGSSVEPVQAALPTVADKAVDWSGESVLAPDIRFAGVAVQPCQFTHPKSLFLTGATGLMGAFLLRDLLQRTDARIHCLVDAEDTTTALQQIRAALARFRLSVDLSRVVPVAGDLAKPRFGLANGQFDDLAQHIDAVFHAGAMAHHLLPYDALKPANVGSVQSVLMLATEQRLKPVHYLSSISVLPAASGPAPVGETDPLDDPGKLGSGYSQSRWVAEKLLERARAQGLPVNIYRPGLTIGDSRHGAGDCDDAFWQLLRACVETGAGPDLNFRSFLVPVDYVSAAAVALSADPSLAGRNFHLVEPNTPSFSEMLRSARRFGFELEILSRDEWVAKVQSIVGERQFDEKLPYLLLIPSEFLDPFIGSLAGLLDEVDSHQTNAALAHVTTPSPQVNDALLHRCFAYLVETGFLPNPNAQGANLALQHEAAS